MRRFILCLTISIFTLSVGYAEMVPPQTKKINSQQSVMMGQNFDISIYSSGLPYEDVAAFYRQKLLGAGWEETGIPQGTQALAGINSMTFKKNNDVIVVTRVPAMRESMTIFSVGAGRLPDFTKGEKATNQEKEISFAPVYPGAKQVSYTQTKQGVTTGYLATADMDDILYFYETKMPAYGWYVTGREDVKKIESDFGEKFAKFRESAAEGIAAKCPTCKEASTVSQQPTKAPDAWLGGLRFSNDRGEVCNISLTRVKGELSEEQTRNVVEKTGMDLRDMTVITIVQYKGLGIEDSDE